MACVRAPGETCDEHGDMQIAKSATSFCTIVFDESKQNGICFPMGRCSFPTWRFWSRSIRTSE